MTKTFERNGIKIEHFDNGLAVQHLGFIFDEMFDLGMYDSIDVKDRDILDVGAYYGETAIYFAQRGAKRIIAVEPFMTWSLIQRNALSNGCHNIFAVRAAYGAHSGKLPINGEYINHGAARIVDGQQYAEDLNLQKVDVVTLRELVDQYDLCDAVLKMDCEGSERDGIMSTDRATLRRFQQIVLEYHYVPQYEQDELAKFLVHLKDAGFSTRVVNNKQMVCMVYADRLGDRE